LEHDPADVKARAEVGMPSVRRLWPGRVAIGAYATAPGPLLVP
jgi:hypothetical protein